MEIFKPTSSESRDTLESDDEFYNHSHGMGDVEHTLCGVACEEWGYINTEPRKKITCPDCLRLIQLCREYKYNIKK